MKNEGPVKKRKRVQALLIGIGALIFFGLGYFLGSHAQDGEMGIQAAERSQEAHAVDSDGELIYYTCSMHPQIQRAEPGSCPICGMDLIPVVNESGGGKGPRMLTMSEGAKGLAEIQTTEVLRRFPEAEVRLVGMLEYDETRVKSLTARFPARIDQLYLNFTGVPVRKGDHLARVYSPELMTAQRELLTAHANNPNSSITNAAREKLRLWDLLPEQIDTIVESGEAKDHFDLKAPIAGVVVSKNVKEGDYIKTGDSLFRIVDLSLLWLYLDAYESDLTWLRYGQDVEFTVGAYPGETFHGRIAFIEPELNRKTRTVPVRVNVSNADRRLKPGMFARGIVRSKTAYGGKVYAPELAGKWISPMHPEIVKEGPGQCDICGMDLVRAEDLGYLQEVVMEAPLVIPTSSVLRTGKRAVVYVELPDRQDPTYEGREVVIGTRAGDVFIVEAGLGEGERVVTKGAFKIDSALQIQANPSMMNPEGGGRAQGHQHGDGEMDDSHSRHEDRSDLVIPVQVAARLIGPYLKLQSSLAGDDLHGARESLNGMIEITGRTGALPGMIYTMLASESLEAMRLPHFETLSRALITAVEADPAEFEGNLFLAYCPMAKDNQGADWLQATKPIRNPYFGAMMLRCGEIRSNLTETSEGHDGHAD